MSQELPRIVINTLLLLEALIPFRVIYHIHRRYTRSINYYLSHSFSAQEFIERLTCKYLRSNNYQSVEIILLNGLFNMAMLRGLLFHERKRHK